jgi:hypothetical protein
MTAERKPIVVLYIPDADFFSSTLPPSSLMAAFNGHHNSIAMPDSFNGYLWFVFINHELVTPDLRVFHEKDYTEIQYEELRGMLQEGINSLKINNK